MEEPFDTQQFLIQFQESVAVFATQITAFMNTFAEACKPVIEAGIEMARIVHDAIHEAYLQDGAIYGDTHEGLMRWMHEQGEINRLRARAERIEQHQEAVRDFKRMIAEKRGNYDND